MVMHLTGLLFQLIFELSVWAIMITTLVIFIAVLLKPLEWAIVTIFNAIEKSRKYFTKLVFGNMRNHSRSTARPNK